MSCGDSVLLPHSSSSATSYITVMLGVRSDRLATLLVATPLLGFSLWLIARLFQRAFRNFPPGPKGLPIVGDVLHIADQDWLASPNRKDEYGYIHSQCIQKSAHVPFR